MNEKFVVKMDEYIVRQSEYKKINMRQYSDQFYYA